WSLPDRSHPGGTRGDRGADAGIRAAAAHVADLVVVGIAELATLRVRVADLRHGGHDLAGLTIAALRDVVVEPRLLHRMQQRADRRGEAFDRDDLVGVADVADLHRADVDGLSIHEARARLADADAAAVLGAVNAEQVADHPQ